MTRLPARICLGATQKLLKKSFDQSPELDPASKRRHDQECPELMCRTLKNVFSF